MSYLAENVTNVLESRWNRIFIAWAYFKEMIVCMLLPNKKWLKESYKEMLETTKAD